MPKDKQALDVNEPPPFLRTWPNVYAAVLSYLLILLILLYIATRMFHY